MEGPCTGKLMLFQAFYSNTGTTLPGALMGPMTVASGPWNSPSARSADPAPRLLRQRLVQTILLHPPAAPRR
jgi:hypothetical protein